MHLFSFSSLSFSLCPHSFHCYSSNWVKARTFQIDHVLLQSDLARLRQSIQIDEECRANEHLTQLNRIEKSSNGRAQQNVVGEAVSSRNDRRSTITRMDSTGGFQSVSVSLHGGNAHKHFHYSKELSHVAWNACTR